MRRGSNILEIFQGVQGATCFSSCLYTVRKNMLQPASVPAYTLLEKICFNLLQFLPIHCQKKYVPTCFSSCQYTLLENICCNLLQLLHVLYTVRKNMLQPASVPAYTLLEKICFNLLQFLPIHCQKKYVATCFSSCQYTLLEKICCNLLQFLPVHCQKKMLQLE